MNKTTISRLVPNVAHETPGVASDGTTSPFAALLGGVLRELADARTEVTDLLLLAWELDDSTCESASCHARGALRALRGAELDIEEHMASERGKAVTT